MNILVTGCNGQLGNAMQSLAPQYPHHRFVMTDVQELDICDAAAVQDMVEREGITCIVNCAAYTQVDKAESDAEKAHMLNAEAPRHLAQAMAKAGGRVIHVSTDYVFDGTSSIPYRETAATCPTTVYGDTKLMGEKYVMETCPNSIIVRTAWLYSPFGNNFVKTMLRLGKERESLGVVADQIGTPTYARDLALALITTIEKDAPSGIYHFSNEGCISWYDFTKAIHRLAGITTCHVKPISTEEYPAPAKRPHYSVLDKTLIKKTLGIEIPYWEDSLKECIDILQK